MFDTDFGADLTIIEEAHEFLTRLEGRPAADDHLLLAGLDQLPGEVLSRTDPARLDLPLANAMLSVLAKTYYAEKAGIDPKKIFMVAVMPCVAKKYEAARPEHLILPERQCPYTDAVLTTRELIWMIKCYGIEFKSLPPTASSTPAGLASGAGDIFGTTGGVMEATPAGGQRAGHRQAGRPAGVHRGAGGRRPARNLRGHRRAQHPRRRGQRADQRQDSVGQSEGRRSRST